MTTNRPEARRQDPHWTAFRILFGGMLGLVVAMGIGRFAFTPILPLMQRDLGMSHALAGWLAGLNYLGYLAGALGCWRWPHLLQRPLVGGGALLASLATTLWMGLTVSPLWWGVLRLGSGWASAVLFIVISAEVAEALARRGHAHWLGALYGGVGAGIALSGAAVPVFDRLGAWSGAWLGMGALAVAAALGGILLGRPGPGQAEAAAATKVHGSLKSLRPLAIAYFFEGLGYIVTATFIVAIIAGMPPLAPFAPYSWVAVGLAAVPSTLFWPWLARRLGVRRALLLAYGLQAAGILVSAFADSVMGVLFAAVSFGGTFMGIVALAMAEGNRRAAHDKRRAAAILTACFGIGQVLGPPAAGIMADFRHGFTLPLLLAAFCVAAGALFIAFDRQFSHHSS